MTKVKIEDLEKNFENKKKIFKNNYPNIDLQLIKKIINCIHQNYLNPTALSEEELYMLNKHSRKITRNILHEVFGVKRSGIYDDIDFLYDIIVQEIWLKVLQEEQECGDLQNVYRFANREGYIAEVEKKGEKIYYRFITGDFAFNDLGGLECVIFDYNLDEYETKVIAGEIEDELIY